MMLPEMLTLVSKLTNKRLIRKGKKELTCQEMLRWIGVCILILSINFHGDRHKLWEGSVAYLEFLPSYNLRTTGTSRNHFDDIWYAFRWSCQPHKQPAGMSSEWCRGMLIHHSLLPTSMGSHCMRTFVPIKCLKANETVICWYGIGDAYVNKGIPMSMYCTLECKLNNGGEILVW